MSKVCKKSNNMWFIVWWLHSMVASQMNIVNVILKHFTISWMTTEYYNWILWSRLRPLLRTNVGASIITNATWGRKTQANIRTHENKGLALVVTWHSGTCAVDYAVNKCKGGLQQYAKKLWSNGSFTWNETLLLKHYIVLADCLRVYSMLFV